MNILIAFENFIYSRRVRGVVEKTIEAYRLHVKRFIDYVGPDCDISLLPQQKIESFLNSLYSTDLTRSTLHSYIRDTKIFLRWYADEHEVLYNFKKIVVPKMPLVERYIYSPDDIRLIFESVKTNSLHTTIRNMAIIAVLLDSGLRQSEVCNLKRIDISFSAGRMKVHGKGNKDRFVPLGKMSSKLIIKYWEVCPYSSDLAFLNNHGEPLTCNAIKSMTGDLQKLLPFEFSSHKLRHNFATNWLINQYRERGFMDVRRLSIIMGHSNDAVTMRYLHVAERIIASEDSISHLDKILLDVI